MRKTLTDLECMEIFRQYDPDLFQFYENHGENFGLHSRMYAESLLETLPQAALGIVGSDRDIA